MAEQINAPGTLIRQDFVITDKPFSEAPLESWMVLVETAMKGDYRSIPLSSFLKKTEPVTVPTLEAVTGQGNRTTRGIIYEDTILKGELQIKSTGITATDRDLKIQADFNIDFTVTDPASPLTPKKNMRLEKTGATVINYRTTADPAKLATFSTGGALVESTPQRMIPLGAGLEWVNGNLTVTGTGELDGDWVSAMYGGTFQSRVTFSDGIRFPNAANNVIYGANDAVMMGLTTNQLNFYAGGTRRAYINSTETGVGTLRVDGNMYFNSKPFTKAMLTVDTNGKVVYASMPGNEYKLPPATYSQLGGVIPNSSHFTVDADGNLTIKNTSGLNNYYLYGVTVNPDGMVDFIVKGANTISRNFANVFLRRDEYTGGGTGVTIKGTARRYSKFNINGNNLEDAWLYHNSDSTLSLRDFHINHGYSLYLRNTNTSNKMLVVQPDGKVIFQTIPTGGTGGGGVSGSTNYFPVFDGSTDGVKDSSMFETSSGIYADKPYIFRSSVKMATLTSTGNRMLYVDSAGNVKHTSMPQTGEQFQMSGTPGQIPVFNRLGNNVENSYISQRNTTTGKYISMALDNDTLEIIGGQGFINLAYKVGSTYVSDFIIRSGGVNVDGYIQTAAPKGDSTAANFKMGGYFSGNPGTPSHFITIENNGVKFKIPAIRI